MSSSITRAGMPASSSHVAKVCRRSWAHLARGGIAGQIAAEVGTSRACHRQTQRRGLRPQAGEGRPPMVARRRGRPVAAARSPSAFAVCPGWLVSIPSTRASVGPMAPDVVVVLVTARIYRRRKLSRDSTVRGTSRNARSVWPARTAPRAGEYQRAWVVACWKPSGDGLSDLAGKRDLTDAGGALWTLESAAVLAACLVAGIDHLEDATVVPSVPADTLA